MALKRIINPSKLTATPHGIKIKAKVIITKLNDFYETEPGLYSIISRKIALSLNIVLGITAIKLRPTIISPLRTTQFLKD